MNPSKVKIHYLRPPDRKEIFEQLLIHDRPDVKVTFAQDLVVEPPRTIGGHVALERGSDIVWFTFPDVWHDIGRFHTADGDFRGYYANILTPPTFHPGGVWRTTDLFLDVWLRPGDDPIVLDRDEMDEAYERGWINAKVRRRALEEVERILADLARGNWPPAVTHHWTRERALELAARGPRNQPSSTSEPSSSTR